MRRFVGTRRFGYTLTREFQEFLAHPVDFIAVLHRKPFQDGSSPGCKRNQDDTTISGVRFPANQPAGGGPINEAYNGVMALLQKFRQLGDCGFPVVSKASDAKHELVLLRRDSSLACRTLTKMYEFAQQVPKVRELSQNTFEILRFTMIN